MLSDWYHSDYFTLVNDTMQGAVPVSNNNLVSIGCRLRPHSQLALTTSVTTDQRQDELSLREHHSCVHAERRHQQVQLQVREEVPP
jgi:hypothetical protein